MRRMTGFLRRLVLVVVALGVALWWGLRRRPAALPLVPGGEADPETVPVPADLPGPVAAFYRQVYGERMPVVTSAVVSGRARLRLNGVSTWGRYRFIHRAGQDYRHYIETTIFGLPLLTIRETYIGGKGRMALPGGVIENDPQVDQGANLGLWGETLFFPSVFLTDPRVRWEAVDTHTARLDVPWRGGQEGEEVQSFMVHFHPQTGLLDFATAERYKGTTGRKVSWRLEPLGWKEQGGALLPTAAAAIWADEGRPWAIFEAEEIVLNVPLTADVQVWGASGAG